MQNPTRLLVAIHRGLLFFPPFDLKASQLLINYALIAVVMQDVFRLLRLSTRLALLLPIYRVRF